MTVNDLIYKIAKRAKYLADLKMTELRSTAGYNCNTEWEAQQKGKGCSRGDLLEEILVEEFVEETDKEIEE